MIFRKLRKNYIRWYVQLSFFKNSGLEIKSVLTDLGDAPHFDDLLGTVKVMLDAYDAGEIQQLSVAYNRFENTMTQTPTTTQLVPMVAAESDKGQKS